MKPRIRPGGISTHGKLASYDHKSKLNLPVKITGWLTDSEEPGMRLPRRRCSFDSFENFPDFNNNRESSPSNADSSIRPLMKDRIQKANPQTARNFSYYDEFTVRLDLFQTDNAVGPKSNGLPKKAKITNKSHQNFGQIKIGSMAEGPSDGSPGLNSNGQRQPPSKFLYNFLKIRAQK
jgi:hypothetical protein